MKINKIVPDEYKFLQITTGIANMPKSLYLLGELPPERLPTVAIVGSRRPTPYGQEVAYKLAFELAARGVVVVSGLAIGIDGIVHQAALDAGGVTIAVLAGGLDRLHPRRHRQLAINILAKGGALLSEYAEGEVPYQGNFVARNRIESAMSDGVIVIEAAAKSGTMHTANFALQQGRAVMAVPGNITSITSEGCNNLIKAGARVVTGVSDVLDELNLTSGQQAALPFADNPSQLVILQLLRQGVRDGDELQQKTGLTVADFQQSLTMLEIQGKVRPLGANNWTIKG